MRDVWLLAILIFAVLIGLGWGAKDETQRKEAAAGWVSYCAERHGVPVLTMDQHVACVEAK